MTFHIHFREMPHSEKVRDDCADLAEQLSAEFPETSKVEITLTQNGEAHETHVHVTGKHVDVASHAVGRFQRGSIHQAVSRARRQLRKHHDKVIAGHRRTAREEDPVPGS